VITWLITDLESVPKRLGWLTWEDCNHLHRGACPWFSTASPKLKSQTKGDLAARPRRRLGLLSGPSTWARWEGLEPKATGVAAQNEA
jgi:hypothetical protein